MTPLAERLISEIKATGPLRVDQFMQRCLLDPQHGYYTTREPFGQKGDFVTAPEISQMFGELLGLALAQTWIDQGCPSPFILAEIGPGRGTLMADLLRATRSVPGFHNAARLHLIEPSARLRTIQAERLVEFHPTHLDHLRQLPDGPLFLVANEALDALPIRQFTHQNGKWFERMVSVDTSQNALAFALSHPLRHLPEGAPTTIAKCVEYCTEAQEWCRFLAERLSQDGAAFLIDYGGQGGVGDTLQALHQGAFDHPLAHPGEADITAHVDFSALQKTVQIAGAACFGPIGQGEFLKNLGIELRAKTLSSPANTNQIAQDLNRLTHPNEMGELFKVLGIAPHAAPVLSGWSL